MGQKDWSFCVVKCEQCGAAARYVQLESGRGMILCTANTSHYLRVPAGLLAKDARANSRDA